MGFKESLGNYYCDQWTRPTEVTEVSYKQLLTLDVVS